MDNLQEIVDADLTLDPQDWQHMRQLGHRMVDDMMDLLENISAQLSWKPIPQSVQQSFREPIPTGPSDIDAVYAQFKERILPFAKGNIHPRFFAWVEGTGTPFGALAELLASAMNPNVAIGEHAAMHVDLQVIEWCKQMMGYPASASGILLSGASMANITALTVARNTQLQQQVRNKGLKKAPAQMTLYCSSETHSCIQKAAEILGLGTEAVRKIAVDEDYRMDIADLEVQIIRDIEVGDAPFCIVANAGTVNTGAIDPLDEVLAIARKYKLWLHIDGAFGALAKLVPGYAPRLKAIEEADSVAFDLHKWMYIPYEAGCVLIKDAAAHRESFAVTPSYLVRQQRGLAGGPDTLGNYGAELSRGFKSLKIWMSIKEHGIDKYAAMIRQNIAQAFYLGSLVEKETCLELLTPVAMNIVCYRYVQDGMDQAQLNALNNEILLQLQEQGIASPSSTTLRGNFAIRVSIVNQRTRKADLELLVKETKRIGAELTR